MRQAWMLEMVAESAEFATPILCSFVDHDLAGTECGYDAVFSLKVGVFGIRHVEICALHFSAGWLKGLIDDCGPITAMGVFQEYPSAQSPGSTPGEETRR